MTRARRSTGVSRQAGNAAAADFAAASTRLESAKTTFFVTWPVAGLKTSPERPEGARALPLIQTGTVSSLTWGLNSAGFFLAGNRLPERWAGRERCVILETGFGFGLNFLATWQAWRRDPARCGKLHFVSVEKHPFTLADLRTLHSRYPEFEREAAELHAAWPMLVPGAHRLELDAGRIVLTLFFSDIKLLRDLRLAADAIYLDGFSPARNPDMWSHALLRAVSRLAAPGATAATWSVAASVRAALESAGFAVEKAAGFSNKKEMLLAKNVQKIEERRKIRRTATVIGAGLAGAAICERLCARGWQVRLIERHAIPAQEASGNHAGTFHPLVTSA